jgi:selenocysteine lyase/cysteine desulfurase
VDDEIAIAARLTPALGDRRLQPRLRDGVYANYAGMTPITAAVELALCEATAEIAQGGVGAVASAMQRREQLRARLADLVGVAPDEIGFVGNTTSGIRALALGLPWRAGDRVVTFEGEFPANVTPWQRAGEVFDLRVLTQPIAPWHDDVGAGLAALERALRDGVRAVAVSAVQFQTGLRMPLAEISRVCKRWGAWLCVDAIQACGVVPIDMARDGIDALACGGHKWLGGVMGLGFVAIRRELAVRLRPVVAGWTSHEDPVGFLMRGPGLLRRDAPIRRQADFVEDGAFPLPLVAALDTAIEQLAQLGIDRIAAHVHAWIDALEPELIARGFTSCRARDPSQRSGILGVRPPHDVDVVALHQRLALHGIACAVPDGVLRFAPHWSNTRDETKRVLDALDLARLDR